MRARMGFLLLLILAIAPPGLYQQQAQAFWQSSAPGPPSQPTYAVKIEFNQRVRMRDGVELSADVYRPDAEGRFPVIVLRTPYNKNAASRLNLARYFAARGYVFVVMDVRGRGDSDGRFVPYVNEGRDGYDTIEWCAIQTWSTGKVGTQGCSYNSHAQWLAAIEHRHILRQ